MSSNPSKPKANLLELKPRRFRRNGDYSRRAAWRL